MNNKKLIRVVISFILLLVTPVYAKASEEKSTTPGQIIITDLAGRNVKVTTPVKRIVLGYAKDFPSLAAITGDSFSGKIIGWGLSRTIHDEEIYRKFRDKYNEIEDIPDVGSHAQGTFSVEKVITLKPDVIIFPLWMLNNQYEGTMDDINKLEQIGIPTVFIDCWEDPFENTVKSIQLLGTILDENNRAQKISEFWQNKINTVTSLLAKIDRPGPSIYFENGSRDPSEYGFSCGKYAWGNIIGRAGGINIADGIIKRWGQINPEYLIKASPEVIVIAEPKLPKTANIDSKSAYEDSKKVLTQFAQRSGWNTITAVKNGRVYAVLDSFIIYNIYNFAAFEALAKWLYPNEFRNLNPEADLRDFYNRFLSVDTDSSWMVGILE